LIPDFLQTIHGSIIKAAEIVKSSQKDISGVTRVFVARVQIKNLHPRVLSIAPFKNILRLFVWDF